MAVSDEEVKAWFAANPNATDTQIVEAAKQAGVGAEQVSRVTQTPLEQVSSRVANVLNPPEPIKPTGGMLGGSSSDLTQPSPVSIGPTDPTVSFTKYEDPFEQAISDIYSNTTGDILDTQNVELYGGMFKEDVESGLDPREAAGKYVNLAMQTPAYEEKVTEEANELFRKGIEEKDPFVLGSMLFNLRESGTKVPPQALEQIFGPEAEGGYDLAGTAGGVLRGLVDVSALAEAGRTDEAQELLEQIQSDPEAYRQSLDADPWADIRWNVLTEDSFYGRSSGGGGGWLKQGANWVVDDALGLDDSGGLIGSIESMIEDGNPIETLDRWKNKGPAYVGAATAGYMVGGPAGASAALSVLGANNTLDSGENLSTAQVIGLALNAGNILDLGQAMYTAAGGGELGAGFLSEQSIMNATQNFGLQGVDLGSLNTGAQALEQAGEVANQVNTLITEPVAAVADAVIQRLGGADYLIEQAGLVSENAFVEGISKGVASATIAEATNKNPTMAFLSEVKGLETLLPSLPGSSKFKEYYQSASEAVASFEDYLKDQGLDPGAISEQIAMVEDWAKENVYDPEELMATISQIEDTVKNNVDLSAVEDTVRIAGDAIAEVTTPVKDAIVETGDAIAEVTEPVKDVIVDTGDAIADVGDAVSDAVSGLDLPDLSLPGVVPMEELAGSDFTAKKGRQGGLDVDTDFLYEEPSLALAILEGRVA